MFFQSPVIKSAKFNIYPFFLDAFTFLCLAQSAEFIHLFHLLINIYTYHH